VRRCTLVRVAIDARKIGDFGIGTYVEGLLGGLARLNGPDEYVVIVSSRFRDRVPAVFERVTADIPNYSVRELFGIARLVQRARVDLYHSAHFVLPFTEVPSVVTIHDVIPLHFRYRNPVARMYYSWMLRRAVSKSARICTVSEAAKSDIVRETGCDQTRIAVTPNGVDPLFFEPHDTVRGHGRYFLYVGNDKPHKNIDTLVGAFSDVRERDASLSLVLAGASFERFRDVAGVRDDGFVTMQQLASLYRGAIALVVPSLEEGFGLPAAEAMAAGTAVITSIAPALVEVTGDAALHIDPRSRADLAAAMVRMATDDGLRGKLGASGVQRARRFTWQRCAEETVRAYRQVLT
jgi:glycosyltransferase involved in cell wall biosynthesis